VVGAAPGTLEQPTKLPPLPASEEEAMAIAMSESPILRTAQFLARAAEYKVKVATGDLLPRVDLRAEYSRGWDTSTFISDSEQKQIMAQLTVPLYQAGVADSVVRKSRQIRRQRTLEVMDAERLVQQTVRNAWESLREAQSRIRADEEQVKANAIALEGVRQEADVGARTTLDVLDAEQEYLDSQVALVTSQRDEVVAAYNLLAAIGRLTARDLGLPVDYYDPEEHYERVENKFFGWTIEDE
jgi:outer membrane protein